MKKVSGAAVTGVFVLLLLFYACTKKTEIPYEPPAINSATHTGTATPEYSATSTPSVTTTATITQTPTAVNTVSCTGKTTVAGNYSRSVTVGANVRNYLVHVPPSYSPGTGMPLVLNFHGGTGSASSQIIITGMNAKSNSAGFIVVYPDGYGNTQTWNAGGCCGEAAFFNIDDVQFTRQMLDAIEEEFCIDTDRIYSCGHSNGGLMSHRLACELSDRIAAIGSVGAGIGDVHPSNNTVYYTCSPPRAVPVMQIHGMQDGCYPYNGGYGSGISNTNFVSIPHTVDDWITRNGCSGAYAQVYAYGNASCISYNSGCSGGSEVVLCTDTEAGHNWLGSPFYASSAMCGGAVTTDINSNDMLWEFFSRHPMP